MYHASAPVLAHGLNSLKHILGKAKAHAAAKQIDASVFINGRLFPDMLPLYRQIHIATDMAKGCVSRLAGVDIPRYEDTEASFDTLLQRIDKTIAHIKTFTAEQIDGSEKRHIQLNMPTGTLEFSGINYLLYFTIPNFYFHITTTYDILRHMGVELGKTDYLGKAA
jgi:hypothetical protein